MHNISLRATSFSSDVIWLCGHAQTHNHAHSHICVRTHTHKFINIHTLTYTHTHPHTVTHTYTHTHTHKHTHPHTSTPTHTHTFTHSQTHPKIMHTQIYWWCSTAFSNPSITVANSVSANFPITYNSPTCPCRGGGLPSPVPQRGCRWCSGCRWPGDEGDCGSSVAFQESPV